MTIKIINQNIALMATDCIVNAANEWLQAGGGVCGAIFREADHNALQKACDEIGYCKPGNAVITPGCGVPAKYVIHAVGPRRESYSEDTLYNAYINAFKLAEENNCRSIAFPVISSGIFKVDKAVAWKVALRACLDYMEKTEDPIDITFCVNSDESLEIGQRVLTELESQRQENKSVDHTKTDKSDFVFFWKTDEANGCFANWFHAAFKIEGVLYPTVEHYMMAKKALLFGDVESYQKIMNSCLPKEAKALGKGVKGFVGSIWDDYKEEIVYNAVYAKFNQNPKLKAELLATGDTILAEASPSDKIWGIGMSADDEDAVHPDRWQGQNLLGKILVKVREELK